MRHTDPIVINGTAIDRSVDNRKDRTNRVNEAENCLLHLTCLALTIPSSLTFGDKKLKVSVRLTRPSEDQEHIMRRLPITAVVFAKETPKTYSFCLVVIVSFPSHPKSNVFFILLFSRFLVARVNNITCAMQQHTCSEENIFRKSKRNCSQGKHILYYFIEVQALISGL